VIVPDANLLLYAYDTQSSHHRASANWWAATLSGSDTVGLTHPALFAFVRIATNHRVYERPMTLAAAEAHVRSWLERKVARILPPPPTHVEDVLELLTAAASSGGNLVTDAQIAALARTHRAVVHTADHDFRRFPGVRIHFPLAASSAESSTARDHRVGHG